MADIPEYNISQIWLMWCKNGRCYEFQQWSFWLMWPGKVSQTLLINKIVNNPDTGDTLAPGRCSCNLKIVIFKLISRIDILSCSSEITFISMPQDLTDNWSILAQVMTWKEPITCANVDLELGHHMASLGHNTLSTSLSYMNANFSIPWHSSAKEEYALQSDTWWTKMPT